MRRLAAALKDRGLPLPGSGRRGQAPGNAKRWQATALRKSGKPDGKKLNTYDYTRSNGIYLYSSATSLALGTASNVTNCNYTLRSFTNQRHVQLFFVNHGIQKGSGFRVQDRCMLDLTLRKSSSGVTASNSELQPSRLAPLESK